MSDVEIQSAGLLILMWAFGLLTMGAVWGFVEAERRAANQADEAEFKDKLDEVREHQDAHGAGVTPLRSRVAAGLHAARLRVAVEFAAFGEDVARLRGRMVVRELEEPLPPAPTRSWLVLDEQADEVWPVVNTAAPVAEPVVESELERPTGRVPVQQMDLVSHARKWNADYQRLLEQKRIERESLQDTGLIERIEEPVSS